MKCAKCGYEFSGLTCPCSWRWDDFGFGGMSLSGYDLASIDDLSSKRREYLTRLAREGSNLLVWGPTGAGKTHSVIALVKWLYWVDAKNVYKLVTVVPKLPSEMSQFIDDNERVRILVIDEITNDHFDLLNRRVMAGRATFATTNLNCDPPRPGVVEPRLDERMLQRFRRFSMMDSSRWGALNGKEGKKASRDAWNRFMNPPAPPPLSYEAATAMTAAGTFRQRDIFRMNQRDKSRYMRDAAARRNAEEHGPTAGSVCATWPMPPAALDGTRESI